MIIPKEIKMTHAQPTQKGIILPQIHNWLRVIQVKNRVLKNALKVCPWCLFVHKHQKVPLRPYRKKSHLVRKVKKLENHDVSIMKNHDNPKTRLAPT